MSALNCEVIPQPNLKLGTGISWATGKPACYDVGNVIDRSQLYIEDAALFQRIKLNLQVYNIKFQNLFMLYTDIAASLILNFLIA